MRKNPCDTHSLMLTRREKFKVYNQNRMTHEVYENNVDDDVYGRLVRENEREFKVSDML